jgi:two-component system LytT family response regulator
MSTSNIHAVVLDDEAPAREIICEYLSDYEEISVLKVFGDPKEAVSYLQSHSVDLLFLDIQMPELTGFEVLAKLKTLPSIIFSTAYDTYALRAFEVHAVDYLLKPYTKERFDEAVQRVLSRAQDREADSSVLQMEETIKQAQNREWFTDQIFIRARNKIIPIRCDDIIWLESEGDYTTIHTTEKSLLCGKRLGELEALLDPDRFIRVHRSSIVAIEKLRELDSGAYGGFTATMENGQQVKVSRTYANRIKDKIW